MTAAAIGVTQIRETPTAEASITNKQPVTLQLKNPSLVNSDQSNTNVDEVLNRVLGVNTGFQSISPNQTEEEEPQKETKEKLSFAWWPFALAGAATAGLAGVAALRRRIVS